VLILGVWVAGGVIAMLGAFIYAELAARMPDVGGQYAYLREAFHPLAGFLYGWVLLLVIQTGGMAAVTVTFARYLLELTNWRVSEKIVAVAALTVLTIINCLGVKLGSRVQSMLMLLKIGAIGMLVMAGLFLVRTPQAVLHPVLEGTPSLDLLTAIGAAMVPVLFAFGGWQTTNFVAAEIKDPRRNLSSAGAGRSGRNRAVSRRESRLCAHAGRSGTGGNHGPRNRSHASHHGRAGGAADRAGNCGLDPGVSQPVRAYGSAGVFRHGE
jgi:APA family basic amino acid/polyamine antiporter